MENKMEKNNNSVLIVVGIIAGILVVLGSIVVTIHSMLKLVWPGTQEEKDKYEEEYDIREEYGDYFKYSFGEYDYDVFEEDYEYQEQLFTGKIETSTIYNRVFSFTDSKGNEREVTITYHPYEIKNEFNKIVLTDLVPTYLHEELDNKIDLREFNKKIDSKVDRIIIDVKRIDETIDTYDKEKGVKFSNLYLSTLKENNLKATYNIRLELGKEFDLEKTKSILEESFGNILKEEKTPVSEFAFSIYDDSENPSKYEYKLILNYDGTKFNWNKD